MYFGLIQLAHIMQKMFQTCLIENNINHVDKFDKPKHLPEARPIEDFWSILKGKVYENNWKAN